ncbi:MAG: SPASM domain-containing protein [Halobacteriovoraceae bacterium]|nr:SPASM domain-containing protein [Halobacteriovoraceae bacterium]
MESCFCPTPFASIVLRPNGDVNPCCLLKHYVIGNVKKNSIKDIINSTKAKKLRKEFLTNNIQTCKANIKVIKCHKWDGHLINEIEKKEYLKEGLKKIDVRLNGKCNLECIMCEVWKQENGTYTEENFWKEARERIFPYLKEIKVLGGEPFIQPDTFRLIREITEINPDCKWSLWTNAAWNFNSNIESSLNKIKNIRMITVSLDSPVKEYFEKIRVKGRFNQVMRTLDQLIAYRDKRIKNNEGFFLQTDMAVQKDNWQDIDAYLKLTQRKKIYPGIFFVSDPKRYSILDLPLKEKLDILRLYFHLLSKTKHSELLHVIRPLLLSLSKLDKLEFLMDIKQIKDIDYRYIMNDDYTGKYKSKVTP